jgi:HK97 family phage prohead protease
MDNEPKLSNTSENSQTETPDEGEMLNGGELVYRAVHPENLSVTADDGPVLIEGRMMPYGEWTEVRSPIEGEFMERFLPGALAKTINEQGTRVRALFEHGLDPAYGRQAIADVQHIEEREDGAYFRAELLDGLPPLLVNGVRRGLYGSSIRYRPIKYRLVRSPRRSDHNPEGIPEVTVHEAFLKEFSITPFPVYAGATAHLQMRSITDEIAARQLLADPKRLLEILQHPVEPQHSTLEEPPEDPAPERSRSTQQPARDYLNPKEERPRWLL